MDLDLDLDLALALDLESSYEVSRTLDFIRTRNYTKVVLQVSLPSSYGSNLLRFSFLYALSPLLISRLAFLNFLILSLNQFPDELLKDSSSVCKALRRELGSTVRVYVMADTAYNSCCIDEVGASYIGAQCVVHYGHACMSPSESLLLFSFLFADFFNLTAGVLLLLWVKEQAFLGLLHIWFILSGLVMPTLCLCLYVIMFVCS